MFNDYPMSTITLEEISNEWSTNILPALMEYITVPNMSPAFDKEWETNGNMDKAMKVITDWVSEQDIPNLKQQLLKLPSRTPLLVCELPASDPSRKEVLFYGHMDKQPPQTAEWSPGLHPYEPVIQSGKLYGRGGADDGYAAFTIIALFKLLEKHNALHGRYLLLIEASEESGSIDLPAYVDLLSNGNCDIKLGKPDLVVCLDSSCSDYEKLWLTTSLRGTINMDLRVATMKQSKHSGDAGAVVPESFNVMREVIDRLVDTNGTFKSEFTSAISPTLASIVDKYPQMESDRNIMEDYPLLDTVVIPESYSKLMHKKVWNPSFTLIGVDLPHKDSAGNVILPEMTFRFSMRVPPYLKATDAFNLAKRIIERDPPFGALVELNPIKHCDGWTMPYDDHLLSIIKGVEPSVAYRGEGGSIPFMNILANKFPDTRFIVTGILGPKSNAHGPNEFLHLDYTKRLTYWIAQIICKL